MSPLGIDTIEIADRMTEVLKRSADYKLSRLQVRRGLDWHLWFVNMDWMEPKRGQK